MALLEGFAAMSMKRTKKSAGSARAGSSEGSFGFNPPTTVVPEWAKVMDGQPEDAFSAYLPAKTYARDTLVDHAKFGKGKVLAVDGGRIEVLFSDGVKKLAHGVA